MATGNAPLPPPTVELLLAYVNAFGARLDRMARLVEGLQRGLLTKGVLTEPELRAAIGRADAQRTVEAGLSARARRAGPTIGRPRPSTAPGRARA
jgi:hypothetical protein